MGNARDHEDERRAGQPGGVSRRDFLKGFSAGAIGAAAMSAAALPAAIVAADGGGDAKGGAAAADLTVVAAAGAPLEITVNGTTQGLVVEPRTTLLALLRERLNLTGPKDVCDRGACGACTVVVDGKPVAACMVLAHDCAGKKVETIEGIGTPESPHALQRCFAECDALQCGFCTPGMLMSLKVLLDRTKSPALAEIKGAVAGNVCRCGTYPRIFEAAEKAAKLLRAGAGGGGR